MNKLCHTVRERQNPVPDIVEGTNTLYYITSSVSKSVKAHKSFIPQKDYRVFQFALLLLLPYSEARRSYYIIKKTLHSSPFFVDDKILMIKSVETREQQ